MKIACAKIVGVGTGPQTQLEIPFAQRTPADHLRTVAKTFVQAQEWREFADYDMSTPWKREESETQVLQVADAFSSWNAIRTELEAQKFLVLLLEPKQRASRA
jgi:hypothetical protein